MSSRQLVLRLYFSGTLSLRYPDTNQIWILVRYDGWNIFPRAITLVFIWPGKVMSCLAHLAGGPIVIVLPFRNVNHSSKRKLKDLFYKLFLMNPLSIQSPTFAWRPCQCYLEACLWYSNFQQEHLKPNAKCFSLNYPNTVVWVMSWNFSPLT